MPAGAAAPMCDDTAMSKRMDRARGELLALSIMALAITLLHLRGLLPGQTFLPIDLANNIYPWRSGEFQTLQNPLVTDPLFEFYPYLVFSVDTIKKTGQWPLWNSNMFLGHPALADPNFQSFYPFYLLLGLVVGAARSLAIGPWLHAILAGCFTFAWIRTMGYSRRAALLGALVYAAGGQMVTWFGARQWLGTLTWLPGVLWAFELFLIRRRWGYLAMAGLFQGLALLSGQYQVWLAFSVFLALYAGLRMAEEWRNKTGQGIRPIVAAASIVVLGGLLAGIQLLPSFEYLSMSLRVNQRLFALIMEPVQLISLLIPDFFGNPATVGEYWGQLNYSERTLYTGLVALLLAVTAPLVVRRRRFLALGLAVLAVVIAVFAIGGTGFEHLRAVPGLRYLSPARTIFLLSPVVALLAAMMLDEHPRSFWPSLLVALLLAAIMALAINANWGDAQEHWDEIQQSVQRAGVLLLAATILLALRGASAKARRWAEAALIGLVFLDLYLWGHTFNPAGPIDQLLPPNEATDFIQANANEQRVAPLLLGWDLAFGPNVLSTFGVAEPGGYSSLPPARLRELFKAGDPGGQHWNILSFDNPPVRLLDLFQVGYIASPRPRDAVVEQIEVQRMTCSSNTGEITAGAPQTGRFTPQDSAIDRLELKFRKQEGAAGEAILLVRLWQGEERQRLIFEERLPVASLTDGQEITWTFAPERTAPGRAYLWEVSAANNETRTGVSLCADAAGEAALAVYGRVWTQVFTDGMFYQQRDAPMPRAYVVYAAETVVKDQEAVNRLLDPDFDLRNAALVAAHLDLPTQAPQPASRAEITEYSQTRVMVKATASQPGLLILGDLYHPGWRATVNAQPAELLRANHVLRGVLLSPGQHEVEFRFQPVSLRNGMLLSLAALLIMVGLLLLDRWQQRRAAR